MSRWPLPLRLLWGLGFALWLAVFAAISWRWMGAQRLTPPSGWVPLLVGGSALALGVRSWAWRPVLFAVAWPPLLWVAVNLFFIQLKVSRDVPLPYLGLFAALVLLAPATVWTLRRDAAAIPTTPTRG